MYIGVLDAPQYKVPDYVNPLTTALQSGMNMLGQGQNLYKNYLGNQVLAAKANVAPQMASGELEKLNLANQLSQKDINWYDPKTRSELALQSAQSNNLNTDATKNQFLMNNPGYIVGGEAGNLQFLKSLGIPINNDTSNQQPTSTNNNGIPSPLSSLNASYSSNPLVNAMYNKMLYGSPINPLQEAYLKQFGQNLTENTTYGNKQLTEANKQADDALGMNQHIDRFLNNYDKSTYKGPSTFGMGGGAVDPKNPGVRSAWHDFTPENETDQAGQTIQQMMIPLLHTNKLTNYELGFLGNLKLNRQMTPDAVHNIGDMLKAFNSRMGEYQRFYLSGVKQGYDPQTLDAMWNLYKQQRPVLDSATNSINKEYIGTDSWKDYLNPQAAKSLQNGQSWEPPITDADIAHTAKVNHMPVAEVKKQLKDQGRL